MYCTAQSCECLQGPASCPDPHPHRVRLVEETDAVTKNVNNYLTMYFNFCIVEVCTAWCHPQRIYSSIDIGAVRHLCYQEEDVNLQGTEMSLKSKNWLEQMKGCGVFLGDEWMQQSATKNCVPLINAVAVSERQAWLAHQSHQRTQGTGGISNKKSTIFILPPSSLTLPHT